MRNAIFGFLAFAMSMLLADTVRADCWGDNRVTFHHTECLHGWWDNNSWPKKSTFGAQVQNDCHLWGTVVAKVDLASCSDKTWHLNNTNKRRGKEACQVRGIYCCKDIGDLCARDDMVTRENCEGEFNKSPASDTCRPSGGTTYTSGSTSPVNITSSVDNSSCTVHAKCEYTADDGSTQEKQSSLELFYLSVKDMVNCDGVLKHQSC